MVQASFNTDHRATEDQVQEFIKRLPENPGERRYALDRLIEQLALPAEEPHDTDENLSHQNSALRAALATLESDRLKYLDLFENAPHGYLVTDCHGTITQANQMIGTMLKIPPESLIGCSMGVFISGEGWQTLREKMQDVVARKEAIAWEIGLESRDGAYLPVLINITPIPATKTGEVGLRWAIRDITDRTKIEKELKFERDQFIAILDGLEEGVYISDLETYEVLYVNPSLARIVGNNAIGSPCFRVFQNRTTPCDFCTNAIILNQYPEPYRWEFYNPIFDRYFELEDRVIRWPDGRNVRLEVAFDITERRRAEEAVRESNERFQTLAETSAAAIMVYQGDTYVYANPSAERITGYSRDELARMKFWEIMHPDEQAMIRDRGQARLRGEAVPNRYDARYRTKDGQDRIIEITAALMTYNGKPAGLITALDVTDRKRTEEAHRESEEQFRSLVENSLQSLVIIQDGRIAFANERAAEFGGWTVPELLAMSPQQMLSLFHPDDRSIITERSESRLAGGREPSRYEVRFIRKDGTVAWAEFFVSLIHFRGRVAHQVSFVDISERKKAEETLRRYAGELQAYAEILKRSNEDLERFAYVSSHDLQEPLRTIVTFTQLLERRYKGQMGKEADEFIDFIVDAGKRMQTLINDLLEFSRVSTRAGALEVVDAETILAQALANLAVKIAEEGAEVTHDPLPKIKADPSQIILVFQNLIGNAMVFHREGVSPRIHVAACRVYDMVQFSVADNGIGIAPEYHDRIFVIFQRLHSREKYPGTGIGLAISKRIIDRHGGKIWVESQPGTGSTFFFTLPAGSRSA